MGKVTARHQGDMVVECTVGNHTIVSDLPAFVGGKDRGPTGTELLAAALCSCVTAAVTFIGTRMGVDLEGMSVDVTYDQETDPYRITNLRAEIHLPNVDDEAKRKGILSAARRCPVHESITSADAIDISLAG